MTTESDAHAHTDEALSVVDGQHRLAALRVLSEAFESDVSRTGEDGAWNRAFGRWLVDALLVGDTTALEQASAEIRNYARSVRGSERLGGALAALAEVAAAAGDRAEQQEVAGSLDPTSWAAKMLIAIDDEPGASNTRLAHMIGVSEASQVSRSGRALLDRGLAVSAHAGRHLAWSVTPRGARVVDSLRARGAMTGVATQSDEVASRQLDELASLMSAIDSGHTNADVYTTAELARDGSQMALYYNINKKQARVRSPAAPQARQVTIYGCLNEAIMRDLFNLDAKTPVAAGLADRVGASRHKKRKLRGRQHRLDEEQNLLIIAPKTDMRLH